MKFDSFGCLVREKPREAGHEIANLGDACADTCRAFVLGAEIPNSKANSWPSMRFSTVKWDGFLRHRVLETVPGWGASDFTNDQLIPLMMAQYLAFPNRNPAISFTRFGFIKGTKKLAQPAVFAILWRQWWLLNILNHIQGWLLGLPFRWSDDDSEGHGFRSSNGKVQDYPTMICTTVFLNRIGFKAKLPRPAEECIQAIISYRSNAKDFEPNAEWEIELYASAVRKLERGGLKHENI